MPRYIDVHHQLTPGLTTDEVAAIHARDLAVQAKYGVRFIKYWYDPATGRTFCLSEAPNREAVLAAHREAHGETADEIFEVFEGE
jgi:hypothetical protein